MGMGTRGKRRRQEELFYAAEMVEAPGIYFRLQLIGFFEGVDSERGIAWRVADSLSLRRFLGSGLDEATPDHVMISRTRRLLDAEHLPAVAGTILGVHKPSEGGSGAT